MLKCDAHDEPTIRYIAGIVSDIEKNEKLEVLTDLKFLDRADLVSDGRIFDKKEEAVAKSNKP